MLSEKQLEIIDYLVVGTYTKAEIATMTGVAERTIYRYMNKDEFKAEWQKRTQAFQSNLKKEAQCRISSKLGMAIDNIIELANNAGSDKIKLDANVFLFEAMCGKATTKVADVTEESNNDDNVKEIEDYLSELEDEDNNVIELDKVK